MVSKMHLIKVLIKVRELLSSNIVHSPQIRHHNLMHTALHLQDLRKSHSVLQVFHRQSYYTLYRSSVFKRERRNCRVSPGNGCKHRIALSVQQAYCKLRHPTVQTSIVPGNFSIHCNMLDCNRVNFRKLSTHI